LLAPLFIVGYCCNWEIDEGGPGKRHSEAHNSEDFQFPQDQDDSSSWSPDCVDYLFLAFNQSTAFGPTNTSVMSKRAKILSMVQALFSLLIIAVVVAHRTIFGKTLEFFR